jgi:hypothetical protein
LRLRHCRHFNIDIFSCGWQFNARTPSSSCGAAKERKERKNYAGSENHPTLFSENSHFPTVIISCISISYFLGLTTVLISSLNFNFFISLKVIPPPSHGEAKHALQKLARALGWLLGWLLSKTVTMIACL